MTAMLAALPLLALLLAAGQGAEQAPVVRGAHFFRLNGGPVGTPAEETNVLPLRSGTCYGWALRVAPEPRTVTIREVFDLPGPGNWGASVEDQFSAVARDRATAVTQFTVSIGEGMISHGWCVSPGDPAGAHRIRVYHGEQLLHDFHFTLMAETN
jgi:hypothetical protein